MHALAASGQTLTKTPLPRKWCERITDAANRRDLEAFLAFYADDIRKFRYPGEMTSQGIEHNRKAHTEAFAAAPNLRIEIVELIALGHPPLIEWTAPYLDS